MARARTYTDCVNIVKMIKIDGKWPFARVVECKGKIVRDHVLVNGKDEHHPGIFLTLPGVFSWLNANGVSVQQETTGAPSGYTRWKHSAWLLGMGRRSAR